MDTGNRTALVEEVTYGILNDLMRLSPNERVLVIDAIGVAFCTGCGVQQPPSLRPCQCENNE